MDFERMFSEHQDRVFAFCYSMTGSRAEAEDVAQEVFLRAWRSLRDWKPERIEEPSERAWLHKIALNVVRNRVRASRSRPPRPASAPGLALVAAPRRLGEIEAPARLAERVLDRFTVMETPLGPFFVAWNRDGVSAVYEVRHGEPPFRAWFEDRYRRPLVRSKSGPPASVLSRFDMK